MKLINKELRIETTNRCNAKCSLCPREKLTRKLTTMPLKHFKYLVDQGKELGVTTVSPFGFGEPLLDSTLVQKVHYCTHEKLDTFITTNASLLNVDIASRLLKAGLKHIRFSVHGLFAQDYERVHKGLRFVNVMRNIFNFIAMNSGKFDGACKTSVTVIPTAGESVEDIREHWEHRVDWLEIWKPHNWVTGRDYRDIHSKPTEEPLLVKKKRMKTCGRSDRGPVQIQADGTVIPCCFLTNSELVLGTTYKNSIEEILKGEKYEKFRRAHKKGKLGKYPCVNCDQLNQDDEPLLYTNRGVGKGATSSIKFNLGG